jgi:putative transposase
LTVDEKVDLVREHRHEYGLNRCCEALALSKGTWHYRMQREEQEDEEEAALKKEMHSAIVQHPGYGYRRLKPEMDLRMGRRVNHKRLRRLLRETNLGLLRQLPRHRPSGVQRILQDNKGDLDLVKGHTWDVLEVLSTDFTELRYAGGSKKAWFIALVDIVGKWAPGWAIGPRRNRQLALECWQQTCESFDDLGMNVTETIVHQDQDSVFTSYAWLRTLLIDAGISVSYSESGARDNPWIESMWGRIKTEIGSLITEAQTLEELKEIMDRHMRYYNAQRRHSAIGYQAPLIYLQQHLLGEDAAAP